MDAGLCQRSHVATLLVLGIGIGGFYARDCLSGVSTELLDHMKLSHTSYALVSTVVSVPTIVLSFVFGWLLDVYGIRRCTIAFTVTLACGALLVAVSTQVRSVGLLTFGRLLTGLGISSMITAQKVYARAIFPKSTRAYATVLALITSGLNCGTFLAITCGYPIAQAAGSYKASVWVGTLAAFLGVGCNLALLRLERNYEYDSIQRRQLLDIDAADSAPGTPSKPSVSHREDQETRTRRQSIGDSIRGQFHPHTITTDTNDITVDDVGPGYDTSALVPERCDLELPPLKSVVSRHHADLFAPDTLDNPTPKEREKIVGGHGDRPGLCARCWRECVSVWHIVKRFSLSYWMLCVIVTCFISAYFTVVIFARDVFESKEAYWASSQLSTLMSSGLVFVMVPMNPVFGVLATSTIPRCVNALLLGTLLFVFGVVWFNTVFTTPWPGVIACGFGGSLVTSTMWAPFPQAMGPLNVDKLGTAFGVVHSAESLVAVVAGIGFGAIKDMTDSYKGSLWFLAGLCAVASAASLVLVCKGVNDGTAALLPEARATSPPDDFNDLDAQSPLTVSEPGAM